MDDLKIKNIDDLVNYILSCNFEGSKEEIQVQQVLLLDNYIKENINYGFDAVNFSIQYPNMENPYEKAFKEERFFEDKIAVCGSISSITNKVLNNLGIKSEYIWGHITTQENGKLNHIGHRWNKINIGNKNFMIDLTANLCNYKYYICFDENYRQIASILPKDATLVNENEYLFFNKLSNNITLGGFIETIDGHIDDIDLQGNLQNAHQDLEKYFHPEYIDQLPNEYIVQKQEEMLEVKDKKYSKENDVTKKLILENTGFTKSHYILYSIIFILIIILILLIIFRI